MKQPTRRLSSSSHHEEQQTEVAQNEITSYNHSSNNNRRPPLIAFQCSPTSKNVIYLSTDYILNEYDVICGRGRTCYDHIGNVRFRTLVAGHLTLYHATKNKRDKTMLIQSIIAQIRHRTPTPGGGFVKKDKITGRYYEVGDFLAVCIICRNIYVQIVAT
jgi:hypothetical protein